MSYDLIESLCQNAKLMFLVKIILSSIERQDSQAVWISILYPLCFNTKSEFSFNVYFVNDGVEDIFNFSLPFE